MPDFRDLVETIGAILHIILHRDICLVPVTDNLSQIRMYNTNIPSNNGRYIITMVSTFQMQTTKNHHSDSVCMFCFNKILFKNLLYIYIFFFCEDNI